MVTLTRGYGQIVGLGVSVFLALLVNSLIHLDISLEDTKTV
jgi:hypothetical protein